jgi:hypothetical protein
MGFCFCFFGTHSVNANTHVHSFEFKDPGGPTPDTITGTMKVDTRTGNVSIIPVTDKNLERLADVAVEFNKLNPGVPVEIKTGSDADINKLKQMLEQRQVNFVDARPQAQQVQLGTQAPLPPAAQAIPVASPPPPPIQRSAATISF